MNGTTFQINEARPYTQDGEFRLYIRTLLATVTEAAGGHVSYSAEVVEEQDRPSFETGFGPVSGTILDESYRRRFQTGEWQIIDTPGLA